MRVRLDYRDPPVRYEGEARPPRIGDAFEIHLDTGVICRLGVVAHHESTAFVGLPTEVLITTESGERFRLTGVRADRTRETVDSVTE